MKLLIVWLRSGHLQFFSITLETMMVRGAGGEKRQQVVQGKKCQGCQTFLESKTDAIIYALDFAFQFVACSLFIYIMGGGFKLLQ